MFTDQNDNCATAEPPAETAWVSTQAEDSTGADDGLPADTAPCDDYLPSGLSPIKELALALDLIECE